ncbi:DUF6992 family protein [Roseivirga echinicomitans]
MKKSLFLTFILVFITFQALGQSSELTTFNVDRLALNKVGMIVLGSWAIGNFATNAVLLKNPSSKEQGHFYRMNIYWNVVNLALAVPGLRNSLITDPSALSLTTSISDYHQMGKVLLVNAGLDVAYITGGFLMKEMAKTRPNKQDLLNGYGKSLILQGGFLFAFDLVMYGLLQSKSDNLNKILETVTVNADGFSLAFRF